jgi:hypothetical protein
VLKSRALFQMPLLIERNPMKQHRLLRFAAIAIIQAVVIVILLGVGNSRADFSLPPEIRNHVAIATTIDIGKVITPSTRSDNVEKLRYAASLIDNAVLPEGKGGVYEAKLLKVKKPFPIYRAYTKKTDPATQRNNRIGGWWAPAPPKPGSTKDDYRRNYEVCAGWNPDLDMVVQCWVYPGALVLIGPGQSVDEAACEKENERYAADREKKHLQIFIFEMYKHQFESHDRQTTPPGKDMFVRCPPPADDLPFERYTETREQNE